jgi:hypothetical protein
MAATAALSFYKGESIVQPFRHVLEGTTTPVDITGWTLSFTQRRRAEDTGTPLLSKTLTVTDGPSGAYELALSHADTVALSAGPYVFDVQRVDAGNEAVLCVGSVTVIQEVLYP